jgi:hypothetical protein
MQIIVLKNAQILLMPPLAPAAVAEMKARVLLSTSLLSPH